MRAKRANALRAGLISVGAAMIAVAALSVASARDVTAARSIVLGKTAVYPESGCPEVERCEVIARVTGIQMVADGVNHPFRSPVNGQLAAWWLRLPRLESSQFRSFTRLFRGEPAARVVIVRRGRRGRMRLIRQSPTQRLKRDLGRRGRARYRLDPPLRIKRGDYVGVTAVTWLPAFAVGLDATGNAWLASRRRSRCNTPPSSRPKRFAAYYRRTQAQLRSSTVKRYQCRYTTARLLYWARIVPDAEPGASP